MAKKIKPVTPGLRFRIAPIFDEITSSNPEKSLLKTLKKSGGRNSKGKIKRSRRKSNRSKTKIPGSKKKSKNSYN